MVATVTTTAEGDTKLAFKYSLSGRDVIIPATALLDDSGNQIGISGAPIFVSSGAGASANQVQGNAAAAAVDSGNPVKIGAKYNATPPTYTDGQRTDAQSNAAGSLKVALTSTAGAEINSSPPADGRSTPASSLATAGFLQLWNNTNWIYARGDANGAVSQPYAMTANRWQYAAASGGIANTTTAVTIASAAGAGVRNYITAIQISNDTLGSATELVVRDGAAGSVIWRMKIGTAVDSGISIIFPVPLKGTANNLLEVATLTATVTGGVYVNAQGFSGT